MARNIKYIVLHCTATPQSTTVRSIQRYWHNFLGWRNPGYHYIIEKDGTLRQLLREEGVANGVRGYNSVSIHVSYIGGVDRYKQPTDNRTPAQIAQMIELIKDLRRKYPNAEIKGHRDFPNVRKACPSFDVAEWIEKVGL